MTMKNTARSWVVWLCSNALALGLCVSSSAALVACDKRGEAAQPAKADVSEKPSAASEGEGAAVGEGDAKAAGATKPASDSPAGPDEFKDGELYRVDLAQGMFVGTLTKNAPLSVGSPSEYCLEDGFLWQGAKYRMGTSNIFDLAIDDALAGKSVIIYGSQQRSLDDKVVKGEKCPPKYGEQESMMQIRSDWTSPECGFQIGRSTHAKLGELSYISAKAAFELRVFEVASETDDAVSLKVRNPFNRALEGAQLQIHYEYVRGKPVPHYENKPITLEAGKETTVEVPKSIEIAKATKGRRGKLHDVTLAAMAGSAELAIKFYLHQR